MNLKYFVIGFVMLVGGILHLIFNKDMGLFLDQNEPRIWNIFNARQRVLIIGFVLIIFGVALLVESLVN